MKSSFVEEDMQEELREVRLPVLPCTVQRVATCFMQHVAACCNMLQHVVNVATAAGAAMHRAAYNTLRAACSMHT